MKRWMKIILSVLSVILITVIVGAAWYLTEAIPIGTGYAAKYLCSGVFISKRKPVKVFQDDIKPVHPL